MKEALGSTSYFVYILRTGSGSYYTGIAKDVETRLAEHRRGRGAKFTKGRGPLTLVYVEAAGGLSSAMRREREIKTFSRPKKESLIHRYSCKDMLGHVLPRTNMRSSRPARHSVAVIGAGPAGIAASIQLKRAGIEPVLFDKARPGGLLKNAFVVENYPGFPEGITGQDLTNRFNRHLQSLRIATITANISSVRREDERIEVRYDGHMRRFSCAIIATGTEPKASDLRGRGPRMLTEIYRIRNVQNKRIAIVGAGDAAFDYALNLSRKNRVTILCRGHKPRALPLLIERAKMNGRIAVLNDIRFTSVRRLHNRTIVQISNGPDRPQALEFDYVVTAIGRRPALGFLSPSLRRTYPRGIPGVLYFAGDVRAGHLRQTAIAVGDGVKVAMQIADSFQEDER